MVFFVIVHTHCLVGHTPEPATTGLGAATSKIFDSFGRGLVCDDAEEGVGTPSRRKERTQDDDPSEAMDL